MIVFAETLRMLSAFHPFTDLSLNSTRTNAIMELKNINENDLLAQKLLFIMKSRYSVKTMQHVLIMESYHELEYNYLHQEGYEITGVELLVRLSVSRIS